MTSFTRRGVPVLVFVALMWLLAVTGAQAQSGSSTSLELVSPLEGSVGQEMVLTARLTNQEGLAVEGAEVIFLRDAPFLNASTELEIGRAVTDSQGLATLSFIPRSEGELLILVDFGGNARYGPSFNDGIALVETGPALYSEEAGVKIPGVNISLLIGVLSVIWGAYFFVMAQMWLIGREDAPPPAGLGVPHE